MIEVLLSKTYKKNNRLQADITINNKKLVLFLAEKTRSFIIGDGYAFDVIGIDIEWNTLTVRTFPEKRRIRLDLNNAINIQGN